MTSPGWTDLGSSNYFTRVNAKMGGPWFCSHVLVLGALGLQNFRSPSFKTTPNGGESDLRTLYCAFAISAMLDDWSGIDVERAKAFVASCRVRSFSLTTSTSFFML